MSKVFLSIIAALMLINSVLVAAEQHQYFFRFDIQDRKELKAIGKVVSIDECSPFDGKTVYAYANDSQWEAFQQLGISYELLPNPGDVPADMSGSARDAMAWDVYPTYDAYVQMMNDFAANYPSLCQVFSIGTTVQGRQLLVAKISDNVATEENEPEVFYTSSMHGDEITGYVLMLRLIDSLLTGYAVSPRIATMVNGMEIFINPLANPDGTYRSGNSTVTGAWRGNANGIDLNRNFMDPQDGPHPDGQAWQPETIAMVNFGAARNFVISANFHGGTEVVNYPWDTWPILHPDDSWWQSISHQYADTAQTYGGASYFNGFNDGITNGYAWYEVDGGRQDVYNYWYHCREATIEISDVKLIAASQLPNHWNWNRLSLLRYLEQVLFGVAGNITDATTSQPLYALVEVVGHDFDSSQVYSDSVHGDYYRMLSPGNYTFRFSKSGYVTQTISNVAVLNNVRTPLNIALQPVPQVPLLTYLDDTAPAALSAGDNISFKVTIRNDGGGSASNAQGILSTTSAYVTVTQNTSLFPLIPLNGGTAQSSSDYQISIAANCPTNHVASFKLNLTADGGYIDSTSFSLTVGQIVEDFEAGDFSSFNWVMGGNQPWTVVPSGVYEGSYSAASGTITHNQNSTMTVSLNVATAGNISFYYKVSSEANWDFLEFYIDGVKKAAWSGSVGWAQASYAVTPGLRQFQWRYVKDGSASTGSDKGWVDFILFPPVSSPLIITTDSLPGGEVGKAYSEQLSSSGGTGAVTWSDLNSDLAGTGLTFSAAGLVSGTPTVRGQITFTARATDQASGTSDKNLSISVILCGDADGSGAHSIADAVFLINHIFSGGQAPATLREGDPDCSGAVSIADAVLLINYIFAGGSAPCSACP